MFVLLLFEGEKSRMQFCEEKPQTQIRIKQNYFTYQQSYDDDLHHVLFISSNTSLLVHSIDVLYV